MRRVVAGDGINGAVSQRRQHGFAVGGRTQRRIHFAIGVVRSDICIGQNKMMRRDLAGHPGTLAFAAPHRFERGGGGDMRHVQLPARLGSEFYIAFHDFRLRGGAHSPQSQAEGSGPRMHRSAGSGARVLGVLYHWQPQGRRRAQRLAHHVFFQNRFAIVGHRHCAGALQCFEIGELLAGAAHRGGRDREHIDYRAAIRMLHPGGDFRRIIHRRGVGHGANGSESASRRRRRSAGDALLVRLPGLAQVHVQINEAWRHD